MDCLANRTDMPFTDLSASAPWRPTFHMTVAQHRARCRQPHHPLIASRAFTRYLCYADVMHVCDCKGAWALSYGGILDNCIRLVALGPNQAARLAVINADRVAYFREHNGSFPKIRLINIHDANGWANLSGPAFKAAITRNGARFFQQIVEKYFTGEDELCTNMRKLIASIVQFNEILYTADMFMSAAEIGAFEAATLRFGEAYQALREVSRRNERLAFNVTPKVHKVQHFPIFARVINPAFLSCYGEESLIGTTMTVWKCSVKSQYRDFVQRNVLVKRLLGLFLRFEP